METQASLAHGTTSLYEYHGLDGSLLEPQNAIFELYWTFQGSRPQASLRDPPVIKAMYALIPNVID